MSRAALHNLLVLLTISILVGVFYGNTLRNGFIHDDHGQVADNTYIHSLMYLPKVFTSCIWESAVGNCKETYYWRPLQSLSYMLTYQLSSQPWIFHLVNLIYFTIDVWLTYILIRLLTGDMLLASLTAGIFLIHPLNTEVVNWIATVPELLFVLFVLLSTICFILYRRTRRFKYLLWLIVSYILGFLAKEPAVFLPFVFLTLDLTYFKKKIPDFVKWKNVQLYVISVISFLIYLWARIRVLGGLGADPYYHLMLPQRIYIFIYLFSSYMRKLVYPYPLNLFYTFHPTYNMVSTDFLITVCTLLAFIVLFVVAVKKKWKLVSFALIWYLAFLAPSLIFINSIGENLFAERHVFASTITFALVLSLILVKLWKLARWGKTITIVLLSIATIGSFVLIYQRNILWKTDEAIFADTLTKSPDADLIRYNLALMYRADGKITESKKQFNIIMSNGNWQGMYKVFNNYGDIVRREGNVDEAEKYFLLALKQNPFHVQALNNLGALYQERGDFLRSVLYLCQANRIDPSFKDANNNFDRLVGMIQRMDEKTFSILYRQLLTTGTFRPADTGRPLTLQNKDCVSSDGCLFTFTNRLPVSTFPLSFLIGGETMSGQIIRPRRFGIKDATGDIILDVDSNWANISLNFTFPTCDGTYYQVTSGAK